MNESIIDELSARIKELSAQTEQEIEDIRVKLLGKKGEITKLFEEFRTVPAEQKRLFGQRLNVLKNEAMQRLSALRDNMSAGDSAASGEDLTMPGDAMLLGARHPISITREEIISIYKKFGYSVAEGPEVEDDWHVFGALNFPPEHPARDMQDTFFINNQTDNNILLRTHTSSIQVRTMETQQLPLRVICPGRVFRNEAISARAHCIFHQVEGLYIDKNVSFADLKQAVLLFAQEMFGADTQIRLRPSYFPFTEPSAEVDVSCNICKGKGCNICKGTGWLEIMGCGMVDPNVLEANGIDSKVYSGFAFGMGVERIAMLKWQVKDLREYFENDVRFLQEFATVV